LGGLHSYCTRFAVSRAARLAPIGFAAVIAAALGSVTPALAFDKVDRLQPVQAGRGYVYFVHEVDAQKQPLPGRTVTVKVGTVPGAGASVAPSDARGHATAAAGASATEVSGADGLAYFVLHTSTTPGENEFIWSDTSWSGEVLVTGLAAGAAAPSPSAAASPSSAAPAAAGGHGGGSSGAAAGSGSGAASKAPVSKAPASSTTAAVAVRATGGGPVPPVLAGLGATVLVWLAIPLALTRRRRASLSLGLPALPSPLPTAAAPPR
jgi:hypothetical protein